MSFAGEVKTELCRIGLNRRCCARAEAYGALLYCNTFNTREIRIVTECDAFAKRIPLLFKKAFHLNVGPVPEGEGKRTFVLEQPEALRMIADSYGEEPGALAHHVNFAVLENQCCLASFLRGAFLAGGSVTDPLKGYHLEIGTSHLHVSREVPALMAEAGFEPKQAKRKSNYIAYFKRSAFIEDFLTTIGAPISAMEVMNAKLEKGIRGGVNRRVNCDAANLDKVVEAALVQIEAINRLKESGQLDSLQEKLQETAQLRLDYPEDTLAQLAQRCDPPITKSAFNHRLRKLAEMGQKIEEPEKV